MKYFFLLKRFSSSFRSNYEHEWAHTPCFYLSNAGSYKTIAAARHWRFVNDDGSEQVRRALMRALVFFFKSVDGSGRTSCSGEGRCWGALVRTAQMAFEPSGFRMLPFHSGRDSCSLPSFQHKYLIFLFIGSVISKLALRWTRHQNPQRKPSPLASDPRAPGFPRPQGHPF